MRSALLLVLLVFLVVNLQLDIPHFDICWAVRLLLVRFVDYFWSSEVSHYLLLETLFRSLLAIRAQDDGAEHVPLYLFEEA